MHKNEQSVSILVEAFSSHPNSGNILLLERQQQALKTALVTHINTSYIWKVLGVFIMLSLAVIHLNKQHQLIIANMPQFWSIYFSDTKNVVLKTFNYEYVLKDILLLKLKKTFFLQYNICEFRSLRSCLFYLLYHISTLVKDFMTEGKQLGILV